MTTRLLTAQDGPAYQTLRLKALQTHPAAFFSTFEEESAKHETSFANELGWSYHPPHFGYYGIFDGEELRGFIQLSRSSFPKQQHTAFLYNLYVDSQYHHQGLASQLLTAIETNLQQDHHQPPYRWLYVDVVATNQAARGFYRRHGFKRMGLRKEAIMTETGFADVLFLGKKLTPSG